MHLLPLTTILDIRKIYATGEEAAVCEDARIAV